MLHIYYNLPEFYFVFLFQKQLRLRYVNALHLIQFTFNLNVRHTGKLFK